MKVNWDAKILNFAGDELKEDGKPVTLATLACGVFMNVLRGDEQLSGDEKEKMFQIGMGATKGGIGEITTDQASVLKKRIGQAYTPLVVGRAFAIIEGKDEAEQPELKLVKGD